MKIELRRWFAVLLACAIVLPPLPASAEIKNAPGMTTTAGNAVLPAIGPGTGSAPYNLVKGGAVAPPLSTAVRPSAFGTWGAGATSPFTGDLSNMGYGVYHATTGVSVGTTGAPATGYQITQELSGLAIYGFNSSGNNQSTSSNDGRTGVFNTYGQVYQHGQGDYTDHFCNAFVDTTRAGATSYLATPEIGCLTGQLLSGASGAYLEGIGDINFKDNGFDDAVVGLNFNFTRQNATGALNSNWGAWSFQNQGTLPIDYMVRATGAVRLGLDFSDLSYPDNTLVVAALSNGGTGYSVGDLLSPPDGTADQPLVIKVLTVNGSGVIQTFGIDRSGLYTVNPALSSSVIGGTGTGAVFTIQFTTSTTTPAIATKANECWYGSATQNVGVYSTGLPSTLALGTSYICYNSALGAWNLVASNASVLQLYGGATGAIFPNGSGGIRYGLHILSKTTNYAVAAGDILGAAFDNAGASGEVDFSLPAATAGLSGCFSVVTGQTLKVIANGTDKIAIAGSNSAAGGNVVANALYASVCIKAHSTGQWFAYASPDKTQWTVN